MQTVGRERYGHAHALASPARSRGTSGSRRANRKLRDLWQTIVSSGSSLTQNLIAPSAARSSRGAVCRNARANRSVVWRQFNGFLAVRSDRSSPCAALRATCFDFRPAPRQRRLRAMAHYAAQTGAAHRIRRSAGPCVPRPICAHSTAPTGCCAGRSQCGLMGRSACSALAATAADRANGAHSARQ